LAGISEAVLYHHGEVSLQGAIVGLARTTLVPTTSIFSDRTGTWYQDPGWKDCASARYIHTELSAATMKIFRPEDAPLEYREDDGIKIEPTFYVPIPMVLVNSSIGIGTGFSTCIPSFDPWTSSTTPEDTHCPKNYNR
jgi:DNA topoisomerase-2